MPKLYKYSSISSELTRRARGARVLPNHGEGESLSLVAQVGGVVFFFFRPANRVAAKFGSIERKRDRERELISIW